MDGRIQRREVGLGGTQIVPEGLPPDNGYVQLRQPAHPSGALEQSEPLHRAGQFMHVPERWIELLAAADDSLPERARLKRLTARAEEVFTKSLLPHNPSLAAGG